MPRLDVAEVLDATFVFLVVLSSLGVARDFRFVFFVAILAGADAVGFRLVDAFFMLDVVVCCRCENECCAMNAKVVLCTNRDSGDVKVSCDDQHHELHVLLVFLSWINL